MQIPSPCIKLCRLDPKLQLCEGCWRTRQEIAEWSTLDDPAKQYVLDLIKLRKQP